MKFAYKIWSNYDGFTPKQIPSRQLQGGRLQLGWNQYVEAVEEGSEIWIYFHGSHAFDNGVYAKGIADSIDLDARTVLFRIREFSTETSLADDDTNAQIAELVAVRRRQVFLLPDLLETAPECDMTTTASSCNAKRCGSCPTWQQLPLVERRNLGCPKRLPQPIASAYVPAYWVIPKRNFLSRGGRSFRRGYRGTNELFKRFKAGESRLAYPLALGMREALATRNLDDLDCIVPVPLSPDKAEAGEIHRTRLLAHELGRLIGVPVRELLQLSKPISKRNLRGMLGLSAPDFEAAYRQRLCVDPGVQNHRRIALLDDVCTEGSTLRAAYQRLTSTNPDLEIVAVTSGQMTVRAAVRSEDDLAE